VLQTGVAGTRYPGLERPRLSEILYFLLPAVAAPGLGLAGALDALPAVFFLSALGFLGSRLLLF
jgi:hypothetical protein